MTFEEYQAAALRTASPRTKSNELFHLVLGLAGETGEVAENFKKWVRDDASGLAAVDRDTLTKELGDVLWYMAVLADYFDIGLDDIASTNIAKLADRHTRGVLGGSGDTR